MAIIADFPWPVCGTFGDEIAIEQGHFQYNAVARLSNGADPATAASQFSAALVCGLGMSAFSNNL
jgi:hypothetical protein